MLKFFSTNRCGTALFCFFFFCFISNLNAASISAQASGDWNNTATWSGGVVPGAGDDVDITGGFVVTVTANASCKSILIKGLASGTGEAKLLINAGNTFSVTGDVTLLSGTSASPTYFNARLTNLGTMTVGGNVLLDCSAQAQYGYCYFDQGDGATNVAGNFTVVGFGPSQNSNVTFTGIGSINLTGTDAIFSLNKYGNLNYGALSGLVEISGNNSLLNIAANGSINMGSANGTLKLSGNFTNAGTFTKGTGTVIYQGTVDQTIAPVNYHNLSSTNTGARIIAGSVGISGMFTKGTNAYTTTGSTINFNGTGAQVVPVFQYFNLTVSGARAANQVTLDNSDTIKVAGALSNTSTYTTGSLVNTGSVICYNGSAAQTVSAFPYNHLTIDKPTGTVASTVNNNFVSIEGNCTVFSGVLSIGTGGTVIGQIEEFTFSGNAASSIFEVKDGARLTLLGTSLFPSSFPKTLWKNIILNPNSTVDYASLGSQTIANYQYGNLTCSSTAGLRTLAATDTIKIVGTFTPNAGTINYTITGSTIDYNGTTAQTVSAFNYNNLCLSNSPANITLSGTGSIGIAGIFNPKANSVFKITGSTIDYNGTGAQTVTAFNYNNLTLSGTRTSNSVTLSPTDSIQVAGALANTITFTSGSIINTGSTIVYNGNTAQSVIDFPYNNLSINKPGGTASLTAALTSANLTGNLSIQQDTLSTAGFAITGSTNRNLSVLDPGVLDISGATTDFPTGFTTVTLTPQSWVVYSSTSTQTIGAQNYGNLKSTGTGARTLVSTGVVGVAGDFVSGTNTYTNTGSTVEFNGTGNQSLSGALGGSASPFNNLSINNSGVLATNGLILNAGVSVAGILNMKSGQLILNGKTLVLTNPAIGAITRANGVIISESVDNSSKVQWNIGTTTGEHVIPFGKSITEYIPVKFNLLSGDASNISVATYATSATNQPLPSSPVVVTGIDQQGNTDAANAVVDRFWHIDASTAAGRVATLTFSFLPTEKPSSIATPRVQAWNVNKWDAALAGQGSTATSVTVNQLTSFSTFAIYDNTPPVAAFTSDLTTTCAGNSIKFTDNSLPAATSWNWSFPGGTPSSSTLQNPTVVYNTGGAHNVTLQVGNKYGTNSITKTAYINIGAPAAPTASNNGPICSGSSLNLTANTIVGATYSWTGPNGFTAAVQNPTIASATVASSGTYSVKATVNGCISDVGTTVVTVNPIVNPSVSIASTTGSNSFCAGQTVTYTATPVNGGNQPAYQWIVDGVNVGSNSSIYSTSGLSTGSTISCTMTPNVTCAVPAVASSSPITVTINPVVIPAVSVNITNGSENICSGSSVTFQAAPTNGGASPTYQWKVNGVGVGSNSATYTSNSLANGNKVSCVMTSNANCASPASSVSPDIVMNVTPSVTPSVIIQMTSGTNPFCSGETVAFTAYPVNGGTAPGYDWKVNNVSIGASGSVFSTSILNNMDVVSCVMTSNEQCVTSAIANSPANEVTVKPTPSKPVITQNGLVLTSNQTVGNQWYLNGVSISSATNQSYTVTQNGSYTVAVLLDGCQSEYSTPVVINNVGINEIVNSGLFNVGPNPTSGRLVVKQSANISGGFKVIVYNAIGEQVLVANETNNELDLSNQPAGLYTIKIVGESFSLNQTIIKQ